MEFNVQEELNKVPSKPGVYLMRNAKDTVIYVGKAKVLKNRLRQYFQKGAHNERVTKMVSSIKRFEYIVTDSEYEALILECNLIKRYKPKYNVLLKNDNDYPYIKVTVNEDFPRVLLARRVENDGAKYFGPYYSSASVYTTIDALNRIFPLRSCKKDIREGKKDRVCLNYHIGLCSGPCGGHITKKEYGEIVQQVIDFLSGKADYIKDMLERQMLQHAERLDFEMAAVYRERLKALNMITEKQKMASISEDDFDVVAIAKNDVDASLQIFYVRDGKVSGRNNYFFPGSGLEEDAEIVVSFIKQFYDDNKFIPPRIYSETHIEEEEKSLLSSWLTEKRGYKCEIIIPQRGDKHKLAHMVKENAKISLKNMDVKNFDSLERLKEVLELESIPLRIEAFDISNTGDSEINASRVVFEKGRPNKKEYRRYKIRTLDGRDDYRAMREVISRRFGNSEEQLPDLVLVDGGLGQVNSALEALEELDITVPVYGMVKDNKHRTRGIVSESGEFQLNKDPDLWRFISSIQNEAHRFAIEYNRKLTEKRYKKSALDDIPGIGEKRKMNLYKHFGSMQGIKDAKIEDLLKVKGMTKQAAENVYKHFHSEEVD